MNEDVHLLLDSLGSSIPCVDASAHFRGKRITVMGLGLLGRGVGDARYLAEQDAELIVTDLKSREELATSVAQLEAFTNVTFVLGEHRLEDFRGRDLILKAAGVPLDSAYIAEAKKNGIPVRMSADLFAEMSGVACIGITGTRGKSTVAHMLHTILKAAGKPVLLGGNVRGVSTLALLAEATPAHIAVLELDSWQLQGFGEAKTSPHVAVFTTFYPDHLNYYHDDLNVYLADKANIFLYQKPEDMLVLGTQCAPTVIDKYGDKIEAKTVVVDELKLPDTWTLRVLGVHNRYDAALALAAARMVGIPDTTSREALQSFPGVPGRLELLREVRGVKIYNDTTSTTPEATIAAIDALRQSSGQNQNLILILGGSDKKLDMDKLLAKLPEVKKVILLAGSGTERIRETVLGAPVYDTLVEAVTDAFDAATPGDAVLFSPAFTSFGMFKNEFDRGDRFNAIVQTL
ncbi:TPA: UDP-N-acetylmuramoyl-L-alanine--D-glutamate ligase [Candidatus Kaiserbacteria bacterium]|nr:MAG: UDP-N-acetylmuramoylalanine-D-glutamate ligase [Parcubacteria group bacterium GW2011_GWA1_56_13]HCR52476.1 UDP-N-acetylmuramoyl-L-alanine--D-glutamate ligase [Candidatus Kaiserbacteria bacterium]